MIRPGLRTFPLMTSRWHVQCLYSDLWLLDVEVAGWSRAPGVLLAPPCRAWVLNGSMTAPLQPVAPPQKGLREEFLGWLPVAGGH